MHHPPHRRWSRALLDTTPRLPRPRRPVEVVLVTRVPFPLRVKLLARPTGVPGERLVGVTLTGRLLAAAPTPEAMITPLADLLAEPAALLLKVRAAPGGVHSRLHAVVPTHRAARALGLPEAACLTSPPGVALPLGELFLAASERRHPHDLRAEARAQMQLLLFGWPAA
jgi:hypothetical protein